ncbi:hypothetical protein LKM28_33925 [Streptomyces sp. CT1-17]|uniref:SMI1/KNR4 family protein n=1 Tax=Streptomyces sp. CT1-17 TaxID=2885642 RepID=UPI001D1220C4|nr:SMI1/KNR4 family protein [Streptomyces sp. CT1-17]MCC2271270.1 hypothetical protein [Streptomyces sp. CT1-17]
MTSLPGPTAPLQQPAVKDSWARIDAWLAEHAPLSRARLRPPASPAGIADAEQRLGVTFPPGLVDALRCHDGVEPSEGALEFALKGPFAGLADIVQNTLFLRSVGEDVPELYEAEDDHELNAFWRHEWLLITLGVTWDAQDGLFLTCRAGDDYGRVGRYFNEDASSFTDWATLRAALAAFADALEGRLPVSGQVPLAFEGRLVWEEATPTVKAEPVSLLDLAAQLPEPAPEPERVRPRPEPPKNGVYLAVGFTEPPKPQPRQPDLVFAAGLTAEELLRRAGVVQWDTVRKRTHVQAERAAASPWAASRPMVRAGRSGEWAFLAQSSGAKQLTRPEVLRRLARGTRVAALTKQGAEVRLTVYADGLPYANGAHDRLVSSPRTDYVRLADGTTVQSVGGDPWPGSTAAYVDMLNALRNRYGIDFDPAGLEHALDQSLPSGLVLPVLEDFPEWSCRHPSRVRHFDLGALVERTPEPTMRAATASQLRRLAAESGIDALPDIARTLDAVDRGETPEPVEDGALDLCMRRLVAETVAARPALEPSWRRERGAPRLPVTAADFKAWQLRSGAADALRRFLRLPVPTAAATILHRRLSDDWRSELLSDLSAREQRRES